MADLRGHALADGIVLKEELLVLTCSEAQATLADPYEGSVVKQLFPSTRGTLDVILHTAVGPNLTVSRDNMRFGAIREHVNNLLAATDTEACPLDFVEIRFTTTAGKPSSRQREK